MCDMRIQDKAEYRRLLDEIGADYCPEGRYCIFKEFLVASNPSRRLLVQLKCCDKAKFAWSKDGGKDIGWEETLKRWVDSGLARRFAEVYADSLSPREVFRMTFEQPQVS